MGSDCLEVGDGEDVVSSRPSLALEVSESV